jgi:hypothetical protein
MSLKEARGRGNMGDWVAPAFGRRQYKDEPQHREHNAEIEAKRQAKQEAKRKRRIGAGSGD